MEEPMPRLITERERERVNYTLEELVQLPRQEISEMDMQQLGVLYSSIINELQKINKDKEYPKTIEEVYASNPISKTRARLLRKFAIEYMTLVINRTLKDELSRRETVREQARQVRDGELEEQELMEQAKTARENYIATWTKEQKKPIYSYTKKDSEELRKITQRFRENERAMSVEDKRDAKESMEREAMLGYVIQETGMFGEGTVAHPTSQYDDYIEHADIAFDVDDNLPLILADTTHNQSKAEEKLARGLEQPLKKLSYPTDTSLDDRIGIPIVLGITRGAFEEREQAFLRAVLRNENDMSEHADVAMLWNTLQQLNMQRSVLKTLPVEFFEKLNTTRENGMELYERMITRLEKVKGSLHGYLNWNDPWVRLIGDIYSP